MRPDAPRSDSARPVKRRFKKKKNHNNNKGDRCLHFYAVDTFF